MMIFQSAIKDSIFKWRLSLFLLALLALSFSPLSGANSSEKPATHSTIFSDDISNGYTINFNNVSILEYLKFVSQIGNVNFIYQEAELNFNVTILSEGPTRLIDVMSALIQVLKINGFDLIEQGNNFIITRSGKVSQLAKVFSEDTLLKEPHIPPIMTYVLKVNNANPARLASILTPFLSIDSIIEVSEETRHLIITDITQNIEQIQRLIMILDVPALPLKVDSYQTKHNKPDILIPLVKQILAPLSEGNPIVLVPQENAESIFIVSTPFLVKEALSILESLDLPPSITKSFGGILTGDNLLIYHLKHKPISMLTATIKQIISNLSDTKHASPALIQTLESMKYIQAGHLLFFIGSAQSLKEIQSILDDIDIPYTDKELTSIHHGFYIYKIKQGTEKQINYSLDQLIETLKKAPTSNEDLIAALQSMKWIKENNSLLFAGNEHSLQVIKKILPTFDIPVHEAKTSSKLPVINDFYLYNPTNITAEELICQIQKICRDLQSSGFADLAFLRALSSAKLSTTKSVAFSGDTESLKRVRTLVTLIDDEFSKKEKTSVYIYAVKYAKPTYVKEGLHKIACSLPKGSDLAQTIQDGKYIKDSHSFVFFGEPTSIARIKEILTTLDNPKKAPEIINEFFVYQPAHVSPKDLLTLVHAAAHNMRDNGFTDLPFLTALESSDLTDDSKDLLFIGPPSAIARVKELLPTLDKEPSTFTPPKGTLNDFFIYHPTHKLPSKLLKILHTMGKDMKNSGLANPDLIKTLEISQLTANEKAVLFTGTSSSIEEIKTLLPTIDTSAPTDKKHQTSGFFVYHPTHKSAQSILKLIHDMGKDMANIGLANPSLIHTLKTAQLTANQKAILFTGTDESIAELKTILPTVDISPKKIPTVTKPTNTGFFVYHPLHSSAESIQQAAIELAQDMKASGFKNEDLINALKHAQVTNKGKTILFTGPPETIKELKPLIPSLDLSPISDEETSLFIYKVRHISADELTKDLRDSIIDLPRNIPINRQLIVAINSMRFVESTNSLIFNGTPQAITRIKSLIEHFDIIDPDAKTPVRTITGYKIYKPEYVAGESLIKMLRDFEKNLINSGVKEKGLFDVINHLKWMPPTESILVSGETKAVDEVYALLERFDIPESGDDKKDHTQIERFSDTSFLMYKLEYHEGQEIVTALKKIGDDLAKVGTKLNKEVVYAINSLQWLEITNSLISTGTEDALSRLRELIKMIDVPLKQVFVEVLVIETTVGNALNFGLRWASQGKYRDRFSYATGSFPQNTQNNPDRLISFQQNLSTISETTTPTGTNQFIPFSSGFDLGVIGDIILHNGKSYFSLGSLVNAIKVDGNSIVVINQKLVTQDNQNSTLFVGNNVPYTGSFVNNVGVTTVTTANLEYRDIGVNLSITPKVGNNDVITLQIQQDISELVDATLGDTTSTTGITGITTSKTSSRTVVTVPNKSFLILSGQIQNSQTYNKTGIPCLGGLPVLGAFFSQNDYQKNITNRIIFVRPHIITSFEEYKKVSESQEDVYRSQAHDPEVFDSGLEIVKTPDDA